MILLEHNKISSLINHSINQKIMTKTLCFCVIRLNSRFKAFKYNLESLQNIQVTKTITQWNNDKKQN